MSSGSSSSSSKGKRKKDKSKKDKKTKKAKKSKKDDKKQKKRAEAAKEWFCDRLDAIRYTRQLLEVDANVATELEGLFESLDEGEVVRIDGLDNKQVKKKLRHLLQALKLTPVGENGFKSSDKKVAFATLFADLLRRAHEKNAAEAAAAPEAVPARSVQAAPVQAPAPQPATSVVDLRDANAAECGEEDAAPAAEAPPPAPKRPRLKGPQLPMPGIGAVDGSEDEGSSDAEDGQGPKLAGEERAGVDLNSLPTGSKREGWMTDGGGSLGGLFSEGPGGGPKKDSYEVKRSKAEEEAFEKMIKERGASLMSETMEGKFAGHDSKSVVDDMRRKQQASQEQWGQSEKQQERQRAGAAPGAAKAHRPFNPEEDLQVKKPISGADFSKFVEESGSMLSGRFSRSQVATSFL